VAHFQKIAEVAPPVILYNVPGRTITSLSTESVAELSENKNIVGIKEASGDISLMKSMKSAARSGFIFLSGDDGSYVDFLKAGGHGVISVVTHVIPRQMVDWKKWVQAGLAEHAEEDLQKYKRLIDLLFVEANPIPVKSALQKMGIINSDELRLPLLPLLEKHQQELSSEMKKLGVLK
jgi:4-hydroxy-tetrahydrodipicolinate synthase